MRRLASLFCVLALAACGGRGTTVPPLSAGHSGLPAATNLRSTSSAGSAAAPTLYVAGLDRVSAFPLAASGTPAAERTITGSFYMSGGPSIGARNTASIAGISVGANQTLDVIQTLQSGSTRGCAIFVYAADANGAATPVQTPNCYGSVPRGISGRPSGAIDYLANGPGGQDFVLRLQANGNALARPMLPYPANSHFGLAEDAAADVFVLARNPNRVEEYADDGPGASASPSRTLAVTGTPVAIAVGPDGTVYVGTDHPQSGNDYVLAYAPGATSISRTIGPFPNHVTALAVDDQGEVYVGLTNLDSKGNKVRVYASDANGQATPLRSILNPLPYNGSTDAAIVGLAIAQAPAPPAPSQEAYVAYPDHVDVYPLSANGVSAPSRSITGMSHPFSATSPTNNWVNQAIVVGTDGSLYAMQNEAAPTSGPFFSGVKYLPGASGAAPAYTLSGDPQSYPQKSSGYGQLSLAALDAPDQSISVVASFQYLAISQVPYGSALPSGQDTEVGGATGLATDATGARYVLGRGGPHDIDVYDLGVLTIHNPVPPHAQAPPPTRSIGALDPSIVAFSGLARGSDGTLYAGVGSDSEQVPGSPATRVHIAAFSPDAGPTSSPSRTIVGSFTMPISLAVDAAGDLVVLHDNRMDTFGPNADGSATPLRSIGVPAGWAVSASALALGPLLTSAPTR